MISAFLIGFAQRRGSFPGPRGRVRIGRSDEFQATTASPDNLPGGAVVRYALADSKEDVHESSTARLHGRLRLEREVQESRGNRNFGADYAYTYDAWDNLVKIRAQNDSDVVMAEYTYYANDLRAGKDVDHRGDFDGTFYFYYDGPEVIEERTGNSFYRNYVWGPNHIDELALIMGVNGTYFAYQDANWNVIGLATPGGDLAEEYNYGA